MPKSSKDYWTEREEKQLAENQKQEAGFVSEVNGIYDYMMDLIQKEIDGFYSRYANSEGMTIAEAKKSCSKLDIEEYSRKAKKYVANKTFTDEANAEMKLYNLTMKVNRLEMLKARIGLELVDGFNELQKYFDEILTERTLDEFERQAGILGESIMDSEKKAKAIVGASFNNARFSDRIWMYQDLMKAELSKLLQEGLVQGKNPRQLATHLQKLFGVQKSNAERLMRTELARVQTEAQKQSFIEGGYDEYMFLSLEGLACSVCGHMNHKTYPIAKMMPGTNAPPMHPNCRCSTAAYMKKPFDESLNFEGVPKSWEHISEGEKSDISMVNPKYNPFVSPFAKREENPYNYNCVNCVVAFDLRQRGWNVSAKSYLECNVIRKANKVWENVSEIDASSYEELKRTMLSWHGDSARAFVGFRIKGDIGHAVVAVKNGESLKIIDVQRNIEYSDDNKIAELLGTHIKFWRIDDKEVSQLGFNACEKV